MTKKCKVLKWNKMHSFCSCRRISGDNDTTPIYSNENIPNTDQTEMYTGLEVKEDGSVYQTLAGENEAIYSNTNLWV